MEDQTFSPCHRGSFEAYFHPSRISMHIGEYLCNNLKLLVRISSRLLMKLTFKIKSEVLLISGSVLEENGKLFVISQPYRSFFLNTANNHQTHKNAYFSYSQEKDCIKFKLEIEISPFSAIPIQVVSTIIKNLEQMIPSINLAFKKIGLEKASSKSSFMIKKASIKLKKQVYSLFGYESFNFQEGSKKQKHERLSCLKIADQIRIIQNKGQIFKNNNIQIDKTVCEIVYRDNKEVRELAIKTLVPEKYSESYKKKLQREQRVVSLINDSNFFLEYWTYKGMSEDSIFMNYVDDSLDICIHHKEMNALQIVNYSKQIVKGVQTLHELGIVHRDLKPDNILVENGQFCQVKIIDFSQSTMTKDAFSEKSAKYLGSTLPFSPIECSIYCQQGFNHKEIDYWSVAMIIHQMLYKKSPISKTNSFLSEGNIHEFLAFVNFHKKKGLRLIQNIYSWISYRGIRLNQKDRINLWEVEFILDRTLEFISTISSIQT